MISLKCNFVFIHIPKTGGNSIQSILKDYSEDKIVCLKPYHDGITRFEVRSDRYNIKKHSTLLDYQLQLSRQSFKRLFKFTCVRNPWDRMISFYFSPHRGALTWNKKNFVNLVSSVNSVMDFVLTKRFGRIVSRRFENIDYYIRYENLNRDFEQVCQRIGIPFTELPVHNESEHEHYATYYDNELIDLVRKKFYKEIKFFSFEFNKR